jgi:hypothetical protein
VKRQGEAVGNKIEFSHQRKEIQCGRSYPRKAIAAHRQERPAGVVKESLPGRKRDIQESSELGRSREAVSRKKLLIEISRSYKRISRRPKPKTLRIKDN